MSGASFRFTGKWIGQRYCIEQELGRGGMGAVYRAFHVDDPSNDVAIKVIHRSQKMTSADLLRFQKEAALMSQLYHSNIIAFHELGIFQGEESKDFSGGYYIVMDYARGKNLKLSLADDGRKDLAFLLQVGIQVADALDYTHGKNIIHRDIKPHNIIVTQAPGDDRGVQVKVLDFGVARLGSVMGRDDGGDERAGTPLYMAPEQTIAGFGVSDHRVDLYSLGCVLYEILTGRPPFSGDNRLAVERAHQGAEAEPIHHIRPDVPTVVSQIIHKLLAKKPDDRYQTAFSLSADLLRAKALWEKKPRAVPTFQLAQKDSVFAVSAQLPLQGRQREIDAILAEYKQVAEVKARGRITVVSGDAGMGKTRVLNEFRANLTTQRIKFVSGIFTQHENALPFNALANAFNELLVKMAKTSPADADMLSRKMRQVIGADAHLVASVVPGLKPYLHEIPEPEDGVDIEGDRYARFTKAFSDFTKSLVPDSQPLVMILDDVHWADEKSLALIEQFFSNANSTRFHVLIGCRLDMSGVDSAFGRFIAKFRGLKLRYAEIELKSLDYDACNAVIRTILRRTMPVDQDLANHLLARSQGIPMRVVELTRKLVALDYIKISGSASHMEFNLLDIQNAKISLNAVDLVLGRIPEYKGLDLAILRSAACCGLTFQYEALLLGGRHAPTQVVRLIERAVYDGVILRYPEPPELKHMGKAYVFVHKKVRDAIYDVIDDKEVRDFHGAIVGQLLSSIEVPQDQMLFAIAQHLNKSLDPLNPEPERENLALRFNVQAGDAIRLKQGWTAADNYYRLALEIIDAGRVSSPDKGMRRRLIERLADVNAGQTKFKVALARYGELLRQPMSSVEFSAAVAKTAQLHLVCGNISESLKLIGRAMRSSSVRMPNVDLYSKIKAYCGILVDAVGGFLGHSPFMRGLRLSWSLWRQLGEAAEVAYSPARLYFLQSLAYGRGNAPMGLAAASLARDCVVRGRASVSMAVKITAERAALLAEFGAMTSSYKLFDVSERLALESKNLSSLGYVSLARAMSIDYIKGRFEDVASHMRNASRKIDRDQDRIAYGTLLVFRQYIDLISGHMGGHEELNSEIRLTLPTRNWLSSVSAGLLMFTLLLQGKRQRLVRFGEEFIRRRKSVGARDDLFTNMVLSLLYFSRGEFDQTGSVFSKVTVQWVGRSQKETLLVWQRDFVELFLMVFPALFEVECGRRLMSDSETYVWLSRMRRGGFFERWLVPDRSTRLLTSARIADIFGDASVKDDYDKALVKAKAEGNILIQVLTYMWFGGRLINSGLTNRGDYLNHALRISDKHGMQGLVVLTRRLMEKYRVSATHNISKDNSAEDVASFDLQWNDMLVRHLDHVVNCINSDSDAETDIAEAVAIIRETYQDSSVRFLIADHSSRGAIVLHAALADSEQIFTIASVLPYFTIRSTLVMHMSPGAEFSESRGYASSEPDLGETLKPESRLDATQVIGIGIQNSMADMPKGHSSESARDSLQTNEDTSSASSSVTNMSRQTALVPLRVFGETIGLIVIDDIALAASKNIHRAKYELDTVGAQIGILLSQKYAPMTNYLSKMGRSMPRGFSVMGGDYFEPVSWLDHRLVGSLRKEREASWYLGILWGEQQYVVVYCCLKGDVLERDRLARQLFLQMLAARELSSMMGEARSDIVDIRSKLNGVMGAGGLADRMDEIMLSYSIFERGQNFVASGHYGPSRPVVLGVENRVTAFNDATLRLRDGRDLRYWEVYAPMSPANVFLVSYDTSRIDGGGQSFISVASQGGQKSSEQNSTTKLLETAVEQKMLPRYYLSVTRRSA